TSHVSPHLLFSNPPAPPTPSTLSLHDALPISAGGTLIQDIPSATETAINHAQADAPTRIAHDIMIAPNTCLSVLMTGHAVGTRRSEEHTSELQSRSDLVCRLLLEKKKIKNKKI